MVGGAVAMGARPIPGIAQHRFVSPKSGGRFPESAHTTASLLHAERRERAPLAPGEFPLLSQPTQQPQPTHTPAGRGGGQGVVRAAASAYFKYASKKAIDRAIATPKLAEMLWLSPG